MDENKNTFQDFNCPQCSLKFDKKSVLNIHLSIMHSQLEDDQEELINFQKSSLKAKNHDKSQLQKQTLKTHIQAIHEGKRPFRCDICDSKFALKYYLLSHLKSMHENRKQVDDKEKTIHCNYCTSSFTNVMRL